MKKMRIFAVVNIDESIRLFDNYVSFERRLSEDTVRYYVGEVRRFGDYLASQGIDRTEEVGPQEVREWLVGLMGEGEAAGTVTKKLAALRAWQGFLRRKGHADTDILVRVAAPKQPKRLPVFFREGEVEQIYGDIYPEGVDGEMHKVVLRMLYETGMRRSELAHLTLDCIDLRKRTVKVRGKGDKERMIPIEAELAGCIAHYMGLREELLAGLAAEGAAAGQTDRLLVNHKGRTVSENMIYTIVERYMAALSQAERTSPHVFRHTFATQMLNEGANIDAIKELLGHSSLNATEVYTHVTREHLKEAYKHAHPRANQKK